MCASKGYIYALGGRNGEVFIDSIERYDPSEDSWMLVGFVRFVNGMKLFMDSVFFYFFLSTDELCSSGSKILGLSMFH